MGLNLNEIKQKINNLVEVISDWARTKGDLYFSSTPKDVHTKFLDSNGNVTTGILPNIAKVIGNLTGLIQTYFYKTVYVDAVNGDDNNAGSEAYPFKTFKKALRAKPKSGSKLTIFILSDIEFRATEIENIHNSEVEIGTKDNAVKRVKFILDSGETPCVRFYKSSFSFWSNVEVETENANGGVLASAVFLDKNSFIETKNKLIIGDNTRLFDSRSSASVICLPKDNTIGNNAKLAKVLYGADLFFIYGSGTINGNNNSDSQTTSYIEGLVLDSNGAPRNFKSNKILG